MISLRLFSAQPTEEVRCHLPSSTCLTFWMSRRTNTPLQTMKYDIPGRVTGGLECIVTEITVIRHDALFISFGSVYFFFFMFRPFSNFLIPLPSPNSITKNAFDIEYIK